MTVKDDKDSGTLLTTMCVLYVRVQPRLYSIETSQVLWQVSTISCAFCR